jgi:hypothetical protein
MPGEVLLGADRQEERVGVGLQLRADVVDRAVEVGADPVHLVDEGEPRDVVLVGLAPDGLGLGLDAGDGVEDRDRAVEDAQRALHLGREVDVPGVSMMLIRCLIPFQGPQEAFQAQEMAAAVIVIPRSRSCSIQSVTVVPSWTSPILWTAPE